MVIITTEIISVLIGIAASEIWISIVTVEITRLWSEITGIWNVLLVWWPISIKIIGLRLCVSTIREYLCVFLLIIDFGYQLRDYLFWGFKLRRTDNRFD